MRNFTYNIIYTLAFTLALLLSGCGKRVGGQRMLAVADSLANANPDSAVAYLNNIKGAVSKMNEETNWRYRLLCMKADVKAYKLSTTLRQANDVVRHFEETEDKHRLSEAYYYYGCLLNEKNLRDSASVYFYRVLNLLGKNERSVLYAKSYSQIGRILSFNGAYESAKSAFMKAYGYNKVFGDSRSEIFSLRDIGGVYYDEEKYDSALYFFDKALALAEKHVDKKELISSIQLQRAISFSKIPNNVEAWKAIRVAVLYGDPAERSDLLWTLADLYKAEGKEDSAFVCYKELAKCGNVYGKKEAYTNLSRYYRSRGMLKEAGYCDGRLRLISDSIGKSDNAEVAVKKYVRYENNQLRKKEHGTWYVITSLAIFMTILVCAFVAYILRRNRRVRVKKTNRKTCLTDEGICKKILAMANSQEIEYRLSSEDFLQLGEVMETYCPGFRARISRLNPITEDEYHMCLLIKIGVKATAVSRLTYRSKAAVSNARNRLAKKTMGEDKKTSDLDNFIWSL